MSFFGINLASRALQAHQRELEVTGQNIANVDTPGYSRQVAIQRATTGPGPQLLDRSGAPLAPGGGVEVARVQRTHADWLDGVAASLNAQIGRAGVHQRAAERVQALLAEPTDSGLAATLDRFFAAFEALAHRPDDAAARDGVTRAGKETAARFQELTRGADALREDLLSEARDNVEAINHLARQVGALSRVIGLAQAAGADPNELLDQRDQLLEELTRRAGVTVTGQTGGQIVVSLGGVALVQGEQVEALDLAPGTLWNLTLQRTGDVVRAPGGELGSQRDWITSHLPDFRTRVEALRDRLASAVNSLHQSGRDRTGAPGEAFFLADSAGNLSVNPTLTQDRRRIAAGDGTAGDGSVALAIASLSGSPSSVLPSYQALVGDVAADVDDTRRLLEQSRASRAQIAAMQASESGVNLDEELAQMVAIQHVYAASARLLSAYDEMLGTLIEQL